MFDQVAHRSTISSLYIQEVATSKTACCGSQRSANLPQRCERVLLNDYRFDAYGVQQNAAESIIAIPPRIES
jgi:hypothetical protein